MAASRYPDKIRLKPTGSIQSASGHMSSSTLPILKLRENWLGKPIKFAVGTPLGFGCNIGVGFGSIGVGFGSIGVGFGFRAGGGGNIAVDLGLAGCPAAGDTGEAEGVGEL